jgi:hypothetical protein
VKSAKLISIDRQTGNHPKRSENEECNEESLLREFMTQHTHTLHKVQKVILVSNKKVPFSKERKKFNLNLELPTLSVY